jgi:hypothetical protein
MSGKIEGVPEGWELVRIGTPAAGETYLKYDLSTEVAAAGHTAKDFVIVRKIEPPKPVYVPWTFETVPLGVTVKPKDCKDEAMMITSKRSLAAGQMGHHWSYANLLKDWEQLDGTPCGTIEP